MHALFLAAAAAVAIASGCAAKRQVVLQPAPGANVVSLQDGGEAAGSTVAGVRVTVRPQAWPGRTPIARVVTPMRVRIENNSGSAILIRYELITLERGDGRTYAALPPYDIEATVTYARLVPGFPVVDKPGLGGEGFAVAPVYAPAYPELPLATHSSFYSQRYFGYYGSHWRRVALPTPDMLRLALPEGSIAPGGHLEGFVYFEEVGPATSRVRFRMEIPDAREGATMGTVEIPFLVSHR